MDGTGAGLVGEEISGDAAQPLAMFGRIFDADEPREAKEHVGAFEVVLPAPLLRVAAHGHGDRVGGALQEERITGLVEGPEVTGPQCFAVRSFGK